MGAPPESTIRLTHINQVHFYFGDDWSGMSRSFPELGGPIIRALVETGTEIGLPGVAPNTRWSFIAAAFLGVSPKVVTEKYDDHIGSLAPYSPPLINSSRDTIHQGLRSILVEVWPYAVQMSLFSARKQVKGVVPNQSESTQARNATRSANIESNRKEDRDNFTDALHGFLKTIDLCGLEEEITSLPKSVGDTNLDWAVIVLVFSLHTSGVLYSGFQE